MLHIRIRSNIARSLLQNQNIEILIKHLTLCIALLFYSTIYWSSLSLAWILPVFNWIKIFICWLNIAFDEYDLIIQLADINMVESTENRKKSKITNKIIWKWGQRRLVTEETTRKFHKIFKYRVYVLGDVEPVNFQNNNSPVGKLGKIMLKSFTKVSKYRHELVQTLEFYRNNLTKSRK